MIEWKDETSWSQRDGKEARATPTTWEANAGSFRLVVTRHIHHSPDAWIIKVYPFGTIGVAKSKYIDIAKEEAIRLLRSICKAALNDIGEEP